MGIKCGRVEVFHDDQLVVALPDEELIAKTLAGLGVQSGQIERSPVLGLALMRELANVDQAVSTSLDSDDIGPQLRQFQHERALSQAGGLNSDVAALVLLIKGIHLKFARDYPGWRVTIGKNYRPSPVKGYPHIGGGNGDPQPTDATLGWRSRETSQIPSRAAAYGWGCSTPACTLTRGSPTATWPAAVTSWAATVTLLRSSTGTARLSLPASCGKHRPLSSTRIQVLDGQGDGTAWEAAVVMAETAQTGMDVVNLSFGEFRTDDNTAPMIFDAAIRQFSPETVLVAAAGNNGDVDLLRSTRRQPGLEHNTAADPAAHVNVVGVGALDQGGHRATFTPDPAPWISLLAPGVGLTGAYVRGVVEIEHKDNQGHVLDSKKVTFPGTAIWEGFFAAGVVSGAIAARTVPGRRSAREALEELLRPDPGQPGGCIVPNRPGT